MSSLTIDLTDSQNEEATETDVISNTIVDREEANHEPTCCRLPSECTCPNVSWLWATHKNWIGCEHIRVGKWMLFLDSENVDEAWLKTIDLLADQQLGGCAKVAPVGRKQNNKHVICVYTEDHENVQEVFAVLHSLRNSGISAAVESTLNYKTDEATYAAIYTSDSAAIAAGFSNAKPQGHKKFRVSKYTSVGFKGNRKVMLKLNNIGPEHLCSLVAEMPLTATRTEIESYFSQLPRTAEEFAEETLQAQSKGNKLVTDFYPLERARSDDSTSAYDYSNNKKLKLGGSSEF